MEVRWIDRDKEGTICGSFARQQSKGQECLPEDALELLAFNAASKAAMESAQSLQTSKEAELLQRLDIAESKLLEFEALKSRVVALETARIEAVK